MRRKRGVLATKPRGFWRNSHVRAHARRGVKKLNKRKRNIKRRGFFKKRKDTKINTRRTNTKSLDYGQEGRKGGKTKKQ